MYLKIVLNFGEVPGSLTVSLFPTRINGSLFFSSAIKDTNTWKLITRDPGISHAREITRSNHH